MYKIIIKRVLDIIISLIGLIILSPIFLLVFVCLMIVNKGKPFFFQERPGINTRVFKIIKFKTMNDKIDKEGNLLPNNLRITKIGGFIRKTSIDEIPQLINVVKGDMSLVGPRPLLVRYLSLYNEEQKRRHDVKPGITGLAQVNGRNTITWSKKFEYDVHYVDNISFKLDIEIIFKTFMKVIKRSDINVSEKITMEAFNGKN